MGAVDLLRDLMTEGVDFEAVGERVKWRNAGSQLSPGRLAILKEGKAEVLQLLTAPDLGALEERAAICEFDGGLPTVWIIPLIVDAIERRDSFRVETLMREHANQIPVYTEVLA